MGVLREAHDLWSNGSRDVTMHRREVIDAGDTVRIRVEVPEELHRRAKAAATNAEQDIDAESEANTAADDPQAGTPS